MILPFMTFLVNLIDWPNSIYGYHPPPGYNDTPDTHMQPEPKPLAPEVEAMLTKTIAALQPIIDAKVPKR